jgi:sugar phosphate isomerase/epimerase
MALLSRWCDALYAVHLSDRSADFTDHQLPGEGFIDFDAITALLRAASFDRPLLLEVMTTHSAHGEPPEAFIQAAYARGCKLYDAIHTR